MEPGSSWWHAVKGQEAHFAAGESPRRHKGQMEKRCVSSDSSQALEKAVQSSRISILGDAQGLEQPVSQVSPALIRGPD